MRVEYHTKTKKKEERKKIQGQFRTNIHLVSLFAARITDVQHVASPLHFTFVCVPSTNKFEARVAL